MSNNTVEINVDESMFIELKKNKKVYADGVYDFTYKDRFVIYHYKHGEDYEYIAVDTYKDSEVDKFGRGSTICSQKKLIEESEFESMIPKITFSIKYVDDAKH